jgi:putative FmdB family regulatory protein
MGYLLVLFFDMPLYTYQTSLESGGCPRCVLPFEVMQKLADARLTVCPDCGQPVKKIITAVHVNTGTTGSPGSTLSAKNIEKNGFTQYRKVGKGQYEKTAGKGPDTFSADD